MVNEETLRRWKKFKKKRESRKEKKKPVVPTPRWVPPGIRFSSLLPEVQTAVVEIVNPIYEELVVRAPSALERSTGLTVVHLLWLEILDQLDLGRGYTDDAFINSISGRPELLGRHLQLVDAKVKASYVLVRLRELRAEPRGAASLSPPDPPLAIPGPVVEASDGVRRQGKS